MAKLQGPKHIEITNAKISAEEVASTVGYSFNSFADDVYNAMNSRLNFDNLNQKISVITVQVDATGAPLQEFILKYAVLNLQGLNVIRAVNTVDNSPVISAPFITFSLVSTNTIKIVNITGLKADTKYQLTVQVIGN